MVGLEPTVFRKVKRFTFEVTGISPLEVEAMRVDSK